MVSDECYRCGSQLVDSWFCVDDEEETWVAVCAPCLKQAEAGKFKLGEEAKCQSGNS